MFVGDGSNLSFEKFVRAMWHMSATSLSGWQNWQKIPIAIFTPRSRDVSAVHSDPSHATDQPSWYYVMHVENALSLACKSADMTFFALTQEWQQPLWLILQTGHSCGCGQDWHLMAASLKADCRGIPFPFHLHDLFMYTAACMHMCL